jgi:hypothetical protein
MRCSLAAGVFLLSACMLCAGAQGSFVCTFSDDMPVIELTHTTANAEVLAVYGSDGFSIDALSIELPDLISYGRLRTSGIPGGRYRKIEHERRALSSLHARSPYLTTTAVSDLSDAAALLRLPLLRTSGFVAEQQWGLLSSPLEHFSFHLVSDLESERIQTGGWVYAEHRSGLSMSAWMSLAVSRFEKPAFYIRRTLLYTHNYVELGLFEAGTHSFLAASMRLRHERAFFASIHPSEAITFMLGSSEFNADHPNKLHERSMSSQLYVQGEYCRLKMFRSRTQAVSSHMRCDDTYRFNCSASYTRDQVTVTCDQVVSGDLEDLDFKQKLSMGFNMSFGELRMQLERTHSPGKIEVSTSVCWNVSSWCTLSVETDLESTQLVFSYKSSRNRAVSK